MKSLQDCIRLSSTKLSTARLSRSNIVLHHRGLRLSCCLRSHPRLDIYEDFWQLRLVLGNDSYEEILYTAWILADRLLMPSVQNQLILEIQAAPPQMAPGINGFTRIQTRKASFAFGTLNACHILISGLPKGRRVWRAHLRNSFSTW